MSKPTVLIVEDSEIDQYIAKHVINKFSTDIKVIQAYDGQEAIDILNDLSHPPIFILLDINMPRMNGHDFLQEFGSSNHKSTPIIMLTSSFQSDEKEKCMKHSSVIDFLTKPLEIQNIKVYLNKFDP